jgi:carboxyl-terminal processing protease
LLQQLQSRHDTRVQSDRDFQRFAEDAAELKVQREKRVISLNEVERRNELTALTTRLKAREQANDGLVPDKDDGLQANERSLNADIAIENARKNAKDVLRNEAASIVADQADLLENARKTGTR